MAKSMQLMKVLIPHVGTYVVTYKETRRTVNPFVISLKTGGHETKVVAYGNYGSCVEHIRQILVDTNNYYREDMPLTL